MFDKSIRLVASAVAAWVVAVSPYVRAQGAADGRPDLQGFWTNATATPLERPERFKDTPIASAAEAKDYESHLLEAIIKSLPEEDRIGADLNDIYLETSGMHLAGGRTALIVDPPDGRLPPPTDAAKARAAARRRSYDDPESMTLDERCLVSTAAGSSQVAAPIVPNVLAGNYYQIIQTRDYVVIFTEWVHDARIIRIGGSHPAPIVQRWLGDSIGRWEGDTLVVDTTNFTPKTHFRGSSERMHVVERFTRVDARTIQYRATVEDPDTWAQPWTIELPFEATAQPILEYACHEGNYAIEDSLRGHRAEEKPKQ